ncbi:MAG: helix-turn-helix transcriptional regulator, partial [Candidatus Peribacteraceae bacterium]|nr:helix-turn-helix transcriptional regulator [Candidatus Peribacteraceae bacterium]
MSHSLTNKLAKLVDSDLYKERSARHKKMIILGEKIYGRRKDLELTQQELATKTGYKSQRAISQLESGEYAEKKGITDEMYSRLA